MPTPLQITTRRHPLSIATYLLVFLLGLLFITQGVKSAALLKAISPFWIFVWEWSMCVGGAVALIGALWLKRLDRGLFLESSGAAISMFGMLTYTAVIIYIAGWHTPGWILFACLDAGLGVRAIGAARDLGEVETATAKPLETFILPAEPPTEQK